jgi:hypothetical protein
MNQPRHECLDIPKVERLPLISEQPPLIPMSLLRHGERGLRGAVVLAFPVPAIDRDGRDLAVGHEARDQCIITETVSLNGNGSGATGPDWEKIGLTALCTPKE